LATAYRRVGEIQLRLGRVGAAGESLGQAIDLAERLAALHLENADYQRDLASIYYQLGNLNKDTSHSQEAEHFYRRSLAIQRELAKRFPSETKYRQLIGTALINLSNVLAENRPDEEEKVLREARTVLEQVTVETPGAAHYHVALGGALNNLAIRVQRRGKHAEARQLLEDAVEHQRAALRINPRSKSALDSLSNHYSCLSEVLFDLGERGEALKAIHDSITTVERLVAEFPQNTYYRSSLAESQAATRTYWPTSTILWAKSWNPWTGPRRRWRNTGSPSRNVRTRSRR
jgi:tetratricopeptide (TPR) repeat protein